MANKDKKKKRLLDGSDIALTVLAALGGAVAFLTIALVAGSLMFPESWERPTAEAPSAQPSYYGTLPSRAPESTPTPAQTDPPEEPSNEPTPEQTDEPAQQTPKPAAPQTQAPQTQAPAVQTQAPGPNQGPSANARAHQSACGAGTDARTSCDSSAGTKYASADTARSPEWE